MDTRYIARTLADAEKFYAKPNSEDEPLVCMNGTQDGCEVFDLGSARAFFEDVADEQVRHLEAWLRFARLSELGPVFVSCDGNRWLADFSTRIYRRSDGVSRIPIGMGNTPYEAIASLYADVTEQVGGQVVVINPHAPDRTELVWTGTNWMDPLKWEQQLADMTGAGNTRKE